MRILLIAMAVLFVNISYAQDFNKAKMDSLFQLVEANNKGMGSISIFENGKEVYHNTIGFASIEEKIPNKKETKFRIGSISKTFTAAIIMKLIEQKKLSLDTKLSKFFPEIKNSDKITIEHLLRHRSGIYNFTNAEEYGTWMQQPISKKDLIATIVKHGNVFEPGEKAEYSNSNYVLLTFIAEKVSGKDFPKLINEFVTKPCDLKNTYYGDEISSTRNEAFSYNYLKDWQKATETDMSVPAGAGAMVSTPTDLNIFLNCLFNGKIVSAASLEKMKEANDGFGIGMFPIPFNDKQAYGHTGGIDGFQSMAFYFPGEKISVAYVSNGTLTPVNDLLIGVLSIYFGEGYDLPLFTKPLELSSEELDKYIGIYTSKVIPIEITITKDGNTLIAQGTGQPSFPLEAYEEHKFRFDQAQAKFEFIPAENKMILRQHGGVYEFDRQ